MLYEIVDKIGQLDPLWWAGFAAVLFVLCCVAARNALAAAPADPVSLRLEGGRASVVPLPRADWRRRVMKAQG